jgi:DNA-binding NtrC family response regulator
VARILSVSYDQSLLCTRQLILEQHGHDVVSALGFTQALKCCEEARDFGIFILGHSIPREDKEALIAAFRGHCSGTVLALKRYNEGRVEGADFETDPSPEAMLAIVQQILSTRRATAD